jgi:hypothetical protein
MVDELHIPIWNRTRKPLTIALSRVGKGLRGRDDVGHVNNVRYKSSNKTFKMLTPLKILQL